MLVVLFRLVIRLALLAAVILVARRALRHWVDGPDPTGSEPPWTPPVPETSVVPDGPGAPASDNGSDPDRSRPRPASRATARIRTTPAGGSTNGGRPAHTVKARTRVPGAPRGRGGDAGRAWVAPGPDGEPPASHPVKAKTGSHTYREPGSTGYDRTRPDRCYPSAQAAEADGFTRAKR